MPKVITFGEIMLRLAPEAYLRFVQAEHFEASYSGAEANVAVSLANYGIESAFVTRLPENEIGQCAVNYLRRFGVDTRFISRSEDGRTGIYFLEKGTSQRGAKVIYDRAGSAVSLSTQKDYDWDSIFEGAEIFMLSGITPALSDSLAEICVSACQIARKKGITVVFDLNYRKKLWTAEKARSVMEKICKNVDICITNEEDAYVVFGIGDNDENFSKIDQTRYEKTAYELAARFDFKKVCITMRESKSASVNGWSGLLYDAKEKKSYISPKYEINIVDRVGAGDAFTAGIIYGELKKMRAVEELGFAVAAGCLKHSIEGDFNMVSEQEVLSLMKGDCSGRVKR
ncbi:sugar kinase [Treponema sp. C6A8]|uniref:sugar kinase n=1 Tax=Treponema sp. C6A8 TaxID=1410609 RepID=UPI000489BB5C|nr:sugar kinase [Treponema sp. C6A8]